MSGIGLDLRQAREREGLSLPELSARTKIRESVLEAVERDDFGVLPAGILGRGYLRAYASEVRLDPEVIVRRYRSDLQPAPLAVALEPLHPGNVTRSRDARPLRSVLRLGALAAVAAVFVQMDDRPMVKNDPDWRVVAAAGGDDLGVADPAPDTRRRAASNPLIVEIDPADVVWVDATADGTRVLDTLLIPGERHVIEAHEWLLLRVGDAGALQYSINGMRGRPLGRNGEVREVRITRNNLALFQDRSVDAP